MCVCACTSASVRGWVSVSVSVCARACAGNDDCLLTQLRIDVVVGRNLLAEEWTCDAVVELPKHARTHARTHAHTHERSRRQHGG
jgi:hypothetical protein